MFGKHHKILRIITEIRESHPSMVEIYTKGGCLNFYKVLKSIYPEAIPWYNGDHVVTKIDDKMYDINGTVKNQEDFMLLGSIKRGTYYRRWLDVYAKL